MMIVNVAARLVRNTNGGLGRRLPPEVRRADYVIHGAGYFRAVRLERDCGRGNQTSVVEAWATTPAEMALSRLGRDGWIWLVCVNGNGMTGAPRADLAWPVNHPERGDMTVATIVETPWSDPPEADGRDRSAKAAQSHHRVTKLALIRLAVASGSYHYKLPPALPRPICNGRGHRRRGQLGLPQLVTRLRVEGTEGAVERGPDERQTTGRGPPRDRAASRFSQACGVDDGNRLEIGSTACVLYFPPDPRRNHLYSTLLCRVAE
jgi:hypothetical protein